MSKPERGKEDISDGKRWPMWGVRAQVGEEGTWGAEDSPGRVSQPEESEDIAMRQMGSLSRIRRASA